MRVGGHLGRQKKKFPGVPVHVLHKNGTEVQLLGVRAKGAEKGLCDPSPPEKFACNSPGL